jgi:hypothetical protein
MGITRKEFVLSVVDQMIENPRAVLAGHGIQAAVLQTIVSRPDVMAKLATILWSTVYAKKGANGLKKAINFKISGYRNFADFTANAREDVEKFIAGLSPDDAAKFTNSNNILTIVLLPQSTAPESDSTIDEIVSGKSVALTFDSAVRKEYKINGGMYLTIMVGDSCAKPVEEKIAERKAKVNKLKQVRRTPAKIIKELKSKAANSLAKLDKKRAGLEAEAFSAEKELEQYKSIGADFGATNTAPTRIIGSINNFDKSIEEVKAIVAGLDTDDKAYFKSALKYKKEGNAKMLKLVLKALNNPDLSGYVMNGAPASSGEVINSRKQALKDSLVNLGNRNEELLAKLAIETDYNKKLSIRSMISKNNAVIKTTRAKLGTYKNISVAGMKKKAQMLADTHAAIEANIAAGKSITEALNEALAKLTAKPEQKEIIKQQVMQQVADGMPMQYAVQQAIQDNIQDVVAEQAIPDMNDTFGSSALSSNFEIQNLLASL